MTDYEHKTAGLYATLGRSVMEFIDMADEADDATLKRLHLMLTMQNSFYDYQTKELNRVGCQIVSGIMAKRQNMAAQ